MRNVIDCINAFIPLLSTEYELVLGRKGVAVTLRILFDKKDCFHLMGLQYLVDRPELSRDRSKVFDEIADGTIAIEKIESSDFYKKIETSYYWDRKMGISIIPNTGIRFVTEKIAVEAKLGLYFSKFDMEAFYLGKEKGLFDEEWMGWWKSYYPDKSKQEYTIRPNISIALSYYL